jgi:PAS domain S-box-containing protein
MDGISSTDGQVAVLFVDDDPSLRELVPAQLERTDDRLVVGAVGDASTALSRLRSDDARVDCVVSDYSLDESDGLSLCRAVADVAPDLPFVLYTAQGSEEIAEEAIRIGVTDYLRKGTGVAQYTLLANRIRQAVAKARAERRLRRRATALETAREGICLVDDEGRLSYANAAYLDLYGYGRDEIEGTRWQRLHPDPEVDRIESSILPQVAAEGGWTGESVGRKADGSTFPEWKSVASLPDGGLVIVVADSRRLNDVGDAEGSPAPADR